MSRIAATFARLHEQGRRALIPYVTAGFPYADITPDLMHGKASEVSHDGKTIFAGLNDHFRAGRYHSLIVERESLPSCLEISANTADDIIMGLRHRELKVEGVQFHPESILTSDGKQLLANFLKL